MPAALAVADGLARELRRLSDAYGPRLLDSDPVARVHRFRDPADQEAAGFLASALAFGRVASIRRGVEDLLARLGPAPAAAIAQDSDRSRARRLRGFRYRWIGESSMGAALRTLQGWILEAGSLSGAFRRLDRGEGHAGALIEEVARDAEARGPARDPGYRFLFPAPSRGSPCKRICLFLRWMARPADGVDLGCWTWLATGRLVIPLDTHLAFMGRALGLTRRPRGDFRAALEITGALARVDAADPVRFDWALSRLGILGLCNHRYDRKRCEPCSLLPWCRTGRARRGT